MDRYAANVVLAPHQTPLAFRYATANAWGASFLRHLRTDAPQHVEAVCAEAQQWFDARQTGLPDAPSHTVLGVCALMVASYRALCASSRDAATAYVRVERCLLAAYEDFIQNICKPLLLNAGRSTQALARMNFQAWSGRMARPVAAALGQSSTGGAGYARCFADLGEPALAQIIEHADRAWIELVASSVQASLGEQRGTRARDRRTSTSGGFEPFRFAPRPSRQRPDPSAVVLELQTHSPADRRGRPFSGEQRQHWAGVERRRSPRRQDDRLPGRP